MTPAPASPTAPRPRDRLPSVPQRLRRVPTRGAIARRRFAVVWAKRLLPVFALALLAAVALWPELHRAEETGRMAFRRATTGTPQEASVIDARYRGVDENGRPFTVTAARADQASEDRFLLADPKADMTMESGQWVMIEAQKGVFVQKVDHLDLSGDVTIWHDNGTTLRTPSAAIDLKAGAAAGNEPVFAQGPFGTLESEGFTLFDKGAVIEFTGNSRVVLTGEQQ